MNDQQRYAGCNHIVGNGFHISMGNETVILRDADGRQWLMEWHHYFGPSAVKKNGDPMKNQPGEHSRFWVIAKLWHDQGCKVVDGVGQWTEGGSK
jgi:hypothetical protein